MISRRLSVILLAGIFTLILAGVSFGIPGEGFFGKDKPAPDGIIPDMPSAAEQVNEPAKAEQTQTQATKPDETPAPAPKSEDKPAPSTKTDETPAPAPKSDDTPANEPEPEPEDTADTAAESDSKPKTRPDYERYSEDPWKVISSYGLDETATTELLNLHRFAARGAGKRERFERYVLILDDYPNDYLAAYMASRNAYDMANYELSMQWLNKALEIHPQYNPARSFRKKIEGGLKRTAE